MDTTRRLDGIWIGLAMKPGIRTRMAVNNNLSQNPLRIPHGSIKC